MARFYTTFALYGVLGDFVLPICILFSIYSILTHCQSQWIYEVVLGSDGISQIGWADADFSCQPWNGKGVGCVMNPYLSYVFLTILTLLNRLTHAPAPRLRDDAHSWAMDGCRLIKSHKGAPSPFGRRWGSNGWQQWKAGDVFGCVYDADNGEISFLANGTGLGVHSCHSRAIDYFLSSAAFV